MKRLFALFAALCLLSACAAAENPETLISLEPGGVTVNGAPISEDPSSPVFLALVNETHEDIPEELSSLSNQVITITAAYGYYALTAPVMELSLSEIHGTPYYVQSMRKDRMELAERVLKAR